MHRSSLLKMQAFLKVYAPPVLARGGGCVLDIGSASKNPSTTYRPLVQDAGLSYVGLDLEAGENVDLVPQHPFLYDEIETASIDLVISGQVFEHNPYFWVTFCEIARILRPGGNAMIIAPGAGAIHRFPYDCWRFYPDSWSVLCGMAGLRLLETIVEPQTNLGRVPGAQWRDTAAVVAKPDFASAAQREGFHRRLQRLTSGFRNAPTRFKIGPQNRGAVWQAYAAAVDLEAGATAKPHAAPPAQRPA